MLVFVSIDKVICSLQVPLKLLSNFGRHLVAEFLNELRLVEGDVVEFWKQALYVEQLLLCDDSVSEAVQDYGLLCRETVEKLD